MEQFPQTPTPEHVEAAIQWLLESLHDYSAELYERSSQELKDEWYDVEMGAEVADDREAAKGRLEQFIAKLEGLRKKGL